ncbi:RE1, partial [Symbiodinium sp. KB8]
ALESAKALEEEKARDEKAHASDSSEEMIAGEAAPPSRAGSPQRRPEQAAAASAGTKRKAEEAQEEAQTGTKRTSEEAQTEAQTSTKRTHEEAQREAQTSAKRTHEEADLDDSNQAMSIRRGNDQHDKHIVTGDADQPPTLEAHVLRDYDDQAEVEEIERLIQMGAEDTFSPASIGSLLRHIVVLAQTWGTPIWVCDVKDAYLNVEQPKDAPVVVDAPLSYSRRYGPKRWKLGRILPGQRRGAQEWFLHLNVDLEAQGLEAMIEVPTLYRATSPKERKAAQVHVDDAMLTGDEEAVNPLLANLREKYTIKVNGPFFPGDEFEFLKRRNTPGPVGDLFMVDDSKALGPTDGTLFRTVVGKLLYIAAERPDVQVVIQFLASKAAAPTEGALRVLKHLAGFMKATEGHGVNLKAAKGASIMNFAAHDTYNQHVVEAVSDSNFATDRATRKSLSSGHVYIDRCLMFSFVRSQKVVTLSSGEAELVALTQTVGKEELKAELYKTKGVNAKTLHLVQLLMGSTLQGCSQEGYEDLGVYLLFCLDLLGTFYEEYPTGFTFLFAALALLAVAFLGYLNGVQWRMTFQIGRWPTSGLEPGCGETGPAQTNEPKNNQDNKDAEDNEDTGSSESDQGHIGTEQGEIDQGHRDTEQSEIDQGRRGTEQGETGLAHQREAPLDPEVVNRMNAWMEENVLPLLGVAPEAEARPSGATSSDEPPPVPPGHLRTTRGVLDPTGLNLGRIVRYAPNWGYGYHAQTQVSQLMDHDPRAEGAC